MKRQAYDHRITWGDCDPAGIVFYPRFFSLFDEATAALLEDASGLPRSQLIRHHGVIGWPMVDMQASFKAPASFDDAVRIESRVARLAAPASTSPTGCCARRHCAWRHTKRGCGPRPAMTPMASACCRSQPICASDLQRTESESPDDGDRP